MSLTVERRQARARALSDFQNPDEPWTEAVVRDHLHHVRKAAEDQTPFRSAPKMAELRAVTDAYCAEFTRLWQIRKANTAKAPAAHAPAAGEPIQSVCPIDHRSA